MTDHIQVGDTAPRVQYAANGSQTAFVFPFPIFAAADMEVWLDSAKQPGSAYTISGIGISGGGTVLFAIPPGSGVRVTLRRRIAITRTSDYQEDGIIRAKVLNDELDYQTAALQQVAEDADRAVKRSFLSANRADLTLPDPSAGRAIKWNAAGDGLENSAADMDLALVAAAAAAAAAAIADTNAAASAATANASAASAQASAAQAQAAATGGVRVGATDTTTGYLQAKLTAGSNITLTRDNPGANETLSIAVSGLGTASALAADTDASLAADSDARIPTQKAVRAYVTANAGISSAEFIALQQDVIQNYLVDAITGAWAAGSYSNGGFDAFNSDTIGANSTGQSYEAGKYYDNPGSYGSQVTPTGSTFGNMTGGGGLAAAFDGNTSQTHGACAFSTPAINGTPAFIGKALSAGANIAKVVAYSSSNNGWTGNYPGQSITLTLYTKATAPSSYNDGTVLGTATVTDSNAPLSQAFTFAPTNNPYIWLAFTSTASVQAECAELQYYPAGSPSDMTLVSSALSPAPFSVPTQVKLMVLHKAIDAATLNSDFTAEASRDGATWTPGVLTDTGLAISGFKALWTVVDVSAQPGGTTVKYRLKTLNAKTQQVKGVALTTR